MAAPAALPPGALGVTPRDGNTDELKAGMYMLSKAGKILRCDGVTPTEFILTDSQGNTGTFPRPWEPVPIQIMEPTPDEALATVESILGVAQVVATKEEGEPFRCYGMGNSVAAWNTHMFLMHGIWTKSGPGSKSLDKIKAAHDLDHEDAEAGHPAGAYVRHRH